jgi:hypothetical protein
MTLTPTVTGGLLALGALVLVLMQLDRRTIVMGVIVAVMAAVMAYSNPSAAVGAEPSHSVVQR